MKILHFCGCSDKGWVDDEFLRPEWPSSVRPNAELSFRGAVAVPESYRIDEFRNALRAVSISVVFSESYKRDAATS
jgi:hypothetical protein